MTRFPQFASAHRRQLFYALVCWLATACSATPPRPFPAPSPYTPAPSNQSPPVEARPGTEAPPSALRMSIILRNAQPGQSATVPAPVPAPAATTTAAIPPRPLVHGDKSLYFQPDNPKIDDEGKRMLQTLATRAKENRRLTIKLIGHSDDSGSSEFDIASAHRRVEAVAQELVRLGVSQQQIRRISHGSEALPTGPCTSDACREKERRVDLIIED